MNHKYRDYDIIKTRHISPYTGKPMWEVPADDEVHFHDTLSDARARIDRMIKSDAEWEAMQHRIREGLSALVRS
ncbi:hypothetical protein RAD16_32730 [Bradyrhizobium sp. 18BD]